MTSPSPDTVASQFPTLGGPRRRRTRWREWALLSLALLVGVGVLAAWQAPTRIDFVIHDRIARHIEREVSPEIVIVAIDDKSLAAVGRWPWRRALHAALLDRVLAAGPRAVGLDLILTETDPTHAADDALLAAAIARGPAPVVLPLLLQDRRGSGQGARAEPVAPLAASAAALGHIHLEIDPDGIVRSTFLREGDGARAWDHFGLAVLRAGGFAVPAPLPGQRRPETGPVAAGAWLRDHWMQIPFAGAPGRVTRVSYVDVLKDQVPATAFAGKYVLVGATGAGMGDAYPTPTSGQAQLMPGVEISAHVMNALLTHQRLERADGARNLAFVLLPVAAALLAVVLLTPTGALLACGALLLATLAATGVAVRFWGLQFAPAFALLGVALAYPLWIWRRLRAALAYLLEEFQRMETRRDLPAMRPAPREGDLLDRHIGALRDASEQLRNLHRFVSDTLGSLPDATLIADTAGRVLMTNQVAQQYFSRQGIAPLKGRRIEELLAGVHRAGTRQSVLDPERLRYEVEPWGGEARDAQGRDLLARFAPCFNTEGQITGWIASLVDITPVREAERQRDVALRFISHDMRSPQSSILALLEVQRLAGDGVPMPPQTLARIERHARRTLDLAEEFVQLARAESGAYQLQVVDLCDLLADAIDEVWPQAMARQIRFAVEKPAQPALCEVDRGLLTRALVNLLGNAVKYGREHTDVDCAVRAAGARWRLSITDRGQGMTPEQQRALFRQFARLNPDDRATRGVGLGLVFVRTVIERHGGHVEVRSQPGVGTTFEIALDRVDG